MRIGRANRKGNDVNQAYTQLMERVRDVGRLGAVEQLLEWDQETYMPKKGVAARAEQSALIAGLAHEHLVADDTRSLLDLASGDPDDYVAETNLRETRRAFQRAVAIPTALVKEIARTSSLAKDTWVSARSRADFGEFAPYLETMLDLKRQVAECVGYEGEPYDALMDEFEPGAKSAQLETLFEELRGATVALLRRISDGGAALRPPGGLPTPSRPDASILTRLYPVDRQATLSRKMAEAIHFDFDSGRADVSVHPFCTTIGGSGDVRITTRYNERFLSAGLFGTLHETGHALYEQGLLPEYEATPMGQAVSLGIHESQSRLWENMVGRSRAFWKYHWKGLQTVFAEALGDVTQEGFYRAINTVRPTLIRVEADELTYNLHIIVRFEIERALLSKTLTVRDVPAAWNAKMTDCVGVTPANDREGCLQDVHWSMGIFGYFPTYALGNLYAAQFFEQANKDIPDLAERMAINDHQTLLDWLRIHIHCHGQRYRAGELVEHVTGEPLSIQPFVRYVTEKFAAVYEL